MYRAYISIGEYKTEAEAEANLVLYEQVDSDIYTIIKEVKE